MATHQSDWYRSAVVRGRVTWSCQGAIGCNVIKVLHEGQGEPPPETHQGASK